MEKIWNKAKILTAIVLWVGCLTIISCGDKDENTDDNNENINNKEQNDDKTGSVGIYKPSDLLGVWTQTYFVDGLGNYDHYPEANGTEYGITFQNETNGRWWMLRNGGATNYDFKWWLENDYLYTVELSSGVENTYKVSLWDGKRTLSLYTTDYGYWEEYTFQKK
jgi:hypothetical protein